jgi:hypothetical protein
MAFDYSGLAQSAEDLIARFGRQVTAIKLSRTPDDGDKPWRGDQQAHTDPAETVDLMAVDVEAPTGANLAKWGFAVTQEDETRRFDRSLLIAARPLEGKKLEEFDAVDDGGTRYRVSRAFVLQPGDTRLLYGLGLAR